MIDEGVGVREEGLKIMCEGGGEGIHESGSMENIMDPVPAK